MREHKIDWMDQVELPVRADYRKRPEKALDYGMTQARHVIDKRGRGCVGRLIAKKR